MNFLHEARLLVPLLITLALISPASGDRIRVEVTGTDIPVVEDSGGYARFSGPGIGSLSAPGEPAIPYRVVSVLLPPGADLSSVSAGMEDAAFETLPGRWNVRPAGAPATWDGTRIITALPPGRTILDGRDTAIYERDALFPGQIMGHVTSGSVRGWKIASVPVALYRYNPVTKSLLRMNGAEVSFSYRTGAEENIFWRSPAYDPAASRRAGKLTVNYGSVAPLYGERRQSGGGLGGTTYVIITTSAIQSALTNLDKFIATKEARGFTVQVVTEGDWGGGTGNGAAENIRSWLQSNYLSSNIEYVLLIGDSNPSSGDVPMKLCYPYSGSCPTDYYYCDLTGNWDLDGDGRYGETNDFGAGGVDRNWDVIVGRIPCYGWTSQIDAVLSKIIDYENTPAADASWRHNVLLPMVQFSGSCLMYQLGEELKDYDLDPKGWTYHRIYENSYGLSPPPETVGASVENTTNTWNASQFGAVIWATHGWYTYGSSVMDIERAATLDDSHPSFVYQGSCSNAHPETTNNLAWVLLQNGGIATVGATRTSYYTYPATSYIGTGSIGGVGYEYGHRLITDELSCGYALCGLKQDVHYWYDWCWQNYIVFNVYGDPSVGLNTTLVDNDADGLPDWWEFYYFDDISHNPGDDDDTGGADGLTNIEEYQNGTDPSDTDSDDDGLTDGAELITHGTDPLSSDTDGDGLNDGDEVNTYGTGPNDMDSDDDGLWDGEESTYWGANWNNNYDGDGITNNLLDPDSDGDGFSDAIEVSAGTDPATPDETISRWRISFQPVVSVRPAYYAPSSDAAYNPDIGYGWQ